MVDPPEWIFRRAIRIILVIAGCVVLGNWELDEIVEQSAARFWMGLIRLEVKRGLHHTGENGIIFAHESRVLGMGSMMLRYPVLFLL